MRGATAAAAKGVNRRGLTNSSIGIGAGIAAGLGAVVPIASQDAQQNHAKNLAAAEDSRTRDIAKLNAGVADRGNYAQSMASAASSYQAGIGNTLQNDKIPAATRNAAQADIAAIYKAQQASFASLYKTALNWS
jgi:hypothetical protein